jgi:hypothetical protein
MGPIYVRTFAPGPQNIRTGPVFKTPSLDYLFLLVLCS